MGATALELRWPRGADLRYCEVQWGNNVQGFFSVSTLKEMLGSPQRCRGPLQLHRLHLSRTYPCDPGSQAVEALLMEEAGVFTSPALMMRLRKPCV